MPQAAGVHFKGFAPSLDLMLGYRVMLSPLRFGAGLKGKVVDSWWHGLPVCTTPVGAEGMRGGPAGTAAGAAAAAGRWPQGHTAGSNTGSSSSDSWGAAADPAEEGYIWQMGGMQTSRASSRSSVAQQSVPDPAAEGHPWQLGPPQPAKDAAQAASAGKKPEAGWGGLWQAATAEELAADAVRLYSEEALWGACQRRGFQLLDELYDRERNLAVVLVSCSLRWRAAWKGRGSGQARAGADDCVLGFGSLACLYARTGASAVCLVGHACGRANVGVPHTQRCRPCSPTTKPACAALRCARPAGGGAGRAGRAGAAAQPGLHRPAAVAAAVPCNGIYEPVDRAEGEGVPAGWRVAGLRSRAGPELSRLQLTLFTLFFSIPTLTPSNYGSNNG